MEGLLGATSLGVELSRFNDMKTSHVGLPVRLRCESTSNESNLMFSSCAHRHETQVTRKPCRGGFCAFSHTHVGGIHPTWRTPRPEEPS